MTDDFKTLAAQLRAIQDGSKQQIEKLAERAEAAGFDPAGLRRFVAWKRKDEAKRAQQEAIDQQCRYLAGERETPAQLPIGCELAQALNLYRRGLTVRQVAEELHVSTGKAGKLKQLSRMFIVHVHATVDKTPDHDPDTGEITETAVLDTPPGEGSERADNEAASGDALVNLIKRSSERFAALTPEQREAELQAQKASFVRGELGMGSDADEAAYRNGLRNDEAGAVGSLQGDRVAAPESDGLEIPTFLRREKVRA